MLHELQLCCLDNFNIILMILGLKISIMSTIMGCNPLFDTMSVSVKEPGG